MEPVYQMLSDCQALREIGGTGEGFYVLGHTQYDFPEALHRRQNYCFTASGRAL